ncbi:nitronate monooxygenase [Virgibacillus halotolerans]|uniref:NAD(P)H-dependent flavin oxidoreductase n=1 Tax=Virgibacillus halotolerans TaxID=1071053 RepID=UPI001960E6D1|nr:nitronate monooxygenase [Virgibacillus halotolerans]MBM7599556.1 nitronate monooxygenase [Virgibacillus halotolerans]
MWNSNQLTDQLKIKYPIIQAGMAGGITTPELVAAVSNAGGLGNVGAGYMRAEDMRHTIRAIHKLTTQPFGVNVFNPEYPETKQDYIDQTNDLLSPIRKELGVAPVSISEDTPSTLFAEQIDVLLEENVPVISFTFGIPSKEMIQKLKAANKILIGTATTVEEAIMNEASGMDMVVVQGSEAGGHRGTFNGSFEKAMIGTVALVPQVVDRVNIPVIAAGGIMDGRGVLASVILGAQGVQMGTAFVTSVESGAKKQHKEAILNSAEDGPVMTSAFSGKPARGVENKFITSMKQHEQQLPDYPIQNTMTNAIRKEAAKQNKPEYMSLWSGQNTRLSQNKSADQIISDIVSQIRNISQGF